MAFDMLFQAHGRLPELLPLAQRAYSPSPKAVGNAGFFFGLPQVVSKCLSRKLPRLTLIDAVHS